MPITVDPKKSKKTYERHPSPSIIGNDRYTPTPRESFNEKRSDIYSKGTKTNHKPYQIESYSKPSSPQIGNIEVFSKQRPELYQLKTQHQPDNIPDRHLAPSALSNNSNRISPMPFLDHSQQRPELYHLKNADDSSRRPPSVDHNNYSSRLDDDHPKTRFDDHSKTRFDDHPGKVTVYYLTTSDEENRRPLPLSRAQRTPSPPVRVNRRAEPVAFEIKDDDYDDNDRVNKITRRRENPPILQTAPRNIHHMSTTQSRASESIQRSMNKYRFGNY